MPQDKPAQLSKTVINFWLDSLLLVLFLLLIWVALVVRFVFPPGPAAGEWLLWGRDYNQWCDIQFAILSLVAFTVLVHLMLHWSWVCGVIATRFWSHGTGAKKMPDDGTRTIWGVGTLIVVLNVIGIGLAAAAITVRAPN
jgi:hypothetical protein